VTLFEKSPVLKALTANSYGCDSSNSDKQLELFT